jgi:hypothetical protein
MALLYNKYSLNYFLFIVVVPLVEDVLPVEPVLLVEEVDEVVPVPFVEDVELVL